MPSPGPSPAKSSPTNSFFLVKGREFLFRSGAFGALAVRRAGRPFPIALTARFTGVDQRHGQLGGDHALGGPPQPGEDNSSCRKFHDTLANRTPGLIVEAKPTRANWNASRLYRPELSCTIYFALALKDELERRLCELNDEWWGKLWGALSRGARFAERGRNLVVRGDDIGEMVSERIASCLWRRANVKGREFLFRRYLDQYRGADSRVLEFSQDVALWGLIGGEMEDWDTVLKGIEERHAMGVGSSVSGRSRWYYVRSRKMPLRIAEKIMDHSVNYPIALVGCAERVCNAAGVRGKLVAVAKVAEKERWFEKV